MGVAPVEVADATIVNPARLSGWLADNICMRCHQADDIRVDHPGTEERDFRPGMPLDPIISIFKTPVDVDTFIFHAAAALLRYDGEQMLYRQRRRFALR